MTTTMVHGRTLTYEEWTGRVPLEELTMDDTRKAIVDKLLAQILSNTRTEDRSELINQFSTFVHTLQVEAQTEQLRKGK